MQNNDHIAKLIYQKLTGKELTEEQKQELQQWLEKSPHNQEVLNMLLNDEWMQGNLELFTVTNSEAVFMSVRKLIAADGQPESIPFQRRRRWWTYVAAAMIVGIVILTGYYERLDKPSEEVVSVLDKNSLRENDVLPGGDKASLSLADGRVILLDNENRGLLVKEKNVNIYSKNGQVVYDAQNNRDSSSVYNILKTAAGQTYKLTLSDGTKVWLNAKSSLRFPVSFSGTERSVDLEGEVYFEIAKDQTKKFLVNAMGTTTEVLGTHFNVNAYNDENNLKVTLLEGSVKIRSTANSGLKSVTIKPGQQAQVDLATGGGEIQVINDVDMEEAVAWKEGSFVFKGENLSVIMRQIARWYDISVEYAGKEPVGKYSGIVSRTTKLSEVLSMLEQSDIHFKMEKRRLIVLP
jgi:transmembrane sensor